MQLSLPGILRFSCFLGGFLRLFPVRPTTFFCVMRVNPTVLAVKFGCIPFWSHLFLAILRNADSGTLLVYSSPWRHVVYTLLVSVGLDRVSPLFLASASPGDGFSVAGGPLNIGGPLALALADAVAVATVGSRMV